MSKLKQLASLMAKHNAIDDEIADLIGRPATRGHVGEWIASKIFGVALASKAVQKGFDGKFESGPRAGKTINVKWYGERQGYLDINPAGVPDYYLVMTGPKAAARSSRGRTLPWVVTDVFLFDARKLKDQFDKDGRKLGVAAYVRQHEWKAARVYPQEAPEALLKLTDAQRAGLKLFAKTG